MNPIIHTQWRLGLSLIFIHISYYTGNHRCNDMYQRMQNISPSWVHPIGRIHTVNSPIHQWTIHRPLLRDSRPREERKDSRRWTASVVTDERLLGWDRMWTGVNYPRILTKQFEFIEIIQNIWAFMGILLLNWFISGFGWFWKVLFRRSAVDWIIWSVHRWFSTRS